ncbi:irsA domain protein [Shigella sonnei 4822-66]|nr:irsA domain protein [Shigella sonnei 4822-66]
MCNYAFHKRFFKLLQLGFDYWTPVGGAITPRERKLVSGFVDYLCESVGREHTPALSEAAEQLRCTGNSGHYHLFFF